MTAVEVIAFHDAKLASRLTEIHTCLVYDGHINPNGYSHIVRDGITWRGHRYTYSLIIGDLVDGLVIDHLCRNRACVNPEHLEQVTYRENSLRGDLANRRKTHCPSGHVYDSANTYIIPTTGGRQCRKCASANKARHNLKRGAA